MQALIVDDDYGQQTDTAVAFLRAGFQAMSTGSHVIAELFIRQNLVDVLIMKDRVGDKLTHSLSLLAECRNPMVETILLTQRTDADIEELFLLLPSLHTLAAPDTSPHLLTKLAISAISCAKTKSPPLILTPEYSIATKVALQPVFSSVRALSNGTRELLRSA